MHTLGNYNCLTCLCKLDDCNETARKLDIPLKQLLMQHLRWGLEELSSELLAMQLCESCFQQLYSFDQFQRQAEECRKQLLASIHGLQELQVKSESKPQITTFEIVYDKQSTEEEQHNNSLLVEPEPSYMPSSTAPSPDPIDEPVKTEAAAELQPQKRFESTVTRRRSKGVKNSFKCTQCGHSFAHSLTLDAHVRKVHEGSKRPFQCDRCNKSYSFMGGLYTHIKEIHGTQARSYNCDHPGCDRVYTSCIAMQKHKRLKHSSAAPARKYVCEQCGATFNQSANLKYHHRTKHPTADESAANARDSEQRYCDICHKHFHSRYTLKYHTMQQHSATAGAVEQMHECQECGKRLAKRFMLVQHMLMHSTDKLPCEHCGRAFARKFELEAHIRAVHLKLKPFACMYCSESFASRKTLRHHEYIHTGEKPYVCSVCGQAFRQQTCLKNHGRVHGKQATQMDDNSLAQRLT